ncbi:MAG: glycosyl hydrolase family 28-related protein [Sulfitobacter sp.]
MNKVITDGLVLMPTPYASGLDVWSSGDGVPGADTYENAANALLIPFDQDFGGALELLKTENTQKLRFMGETSVLPGCYLRISAKVKAISGNLPSVRIGGYAARGDGSQITGLPEFGPSVDLQANGEVVEVSAIVGGGARNGVDMVWGAEPVYGHFGIDLIGPSGGIVRVDDIVIEDVTAVFLSDIVSKVDVLDYGAIGDGVTDNTAAFQAANAGANGRSVYVPEGVYHLNGDVTFDTPVEFAGRVSMPDASVLLLRRNFDLPAYVQAFSNEELAFKKAFQALLSNSDHESLDMGGRKVSVSAPLDMQAAVPGRTSYATRRVIRNGQLEAEDSAAWATDTYTSQAGYAQKDPLLLTDVSNVASIPIGSLVEGTGVGREVYVRDKSLSRQEITLSKPLYGAAGEQTFTFRKFKYIVDFSGFSSLSNLGLSGVELQCNNRCSGIMLARDGERFSLTGCFVSLPADRGVTSVGEGCEGIILEGNQFLSGEAGMDAPLRHSIGFNTNADDAKIRNNRATKFRHFGLLGGVNTLFSGNHLVQGDDAVNGLRTAGVIVGRSYVSTIVSQNHLEDCAIEWTNEADAEPAFESGVSFCGLSVTDNVFLCGDVAPWFSFIAVKPYGVGQFLNGVAITGNRFHSPTNVIDRVDRIDTTFAEMDMAQCKSVSMTGNSFIGVAAQVSNPALVDHSQNTVANAWAVNASGHLPFGGEAVKVDAVVALDEVRDINDALQFAMPHAGPSHGAQRDQVQLIWPVAVRGRVQASIRMDG